jgi:AraC family transcriptional regulator
MSIESLPTGGPGRNSWLAPHFNNIISSTDQLECLIAEENIEDPQIEMAVPYPALVERHALVALEDTFKAKLEWTMGGKRKTHIFTHGDLFLHPAGLITSPRWDRRARLFFLAIRPEFLNQAAGQLDLKPNEELVPSYGFRDNLLSRLIQTIVREFSHKNPDLLYAETLAHAAAAHLLKTATSCSKPICKLRGRLSAQLLQQIMDYVQANMDKKISLEELASLARLSPVHFTRLFRESTGLAPHSWLLERRLAKAEELLCNSRLTIAQIASRTGFSDQSHLTRYFRRSRNVTPFYFRHNK